jgi:hypothetical protein
MSESWATVKLAATSGLRSVQMSPYDLERAPEDPLRTGWSLP